MKIPKSSRIGFNSFRARHGGWWQVENGQRGEEGKANSDDSHSADQLPGIYVSTIKRRST